jgi:DNA-binding NarL/FixJ family response regulator
MLNADEMVRCGRTLALPDRFGAGVLVTILPLETGIGCRQPFATVAIFIQDPALTPPFPGEAFAKLYGLTSAELRVISAMAPGIMPHQVAEALGIDLQIIRTHLRNIFQKTGTARQGNVLALMARANGPANGA